MRSKSTSVLALSFCLLVGTCPPRADATLAKRCGEQILNSTWSARSNVGLFSFGGQNVPVPLGLDRHVFGQWLESVSQTIPAFQAMVLFGSRTHFSYGYLPRRDSDLDVLVFFGDSAPQGALPGLKAHSGKLPCRLNVLHPERNFNQAIFEREFLFPRSVDEHRSLFAQPGLLSFSWVPFLGLDERSQYRDRLYELNPYITQQEREPAGERLGFLAPQTRVIAIGKESLIFLREGSDVASQFAVLNDSGFVNIFTVPN